MNGHPLYPERDTPEEQRYRLVDPGYGIPGVEWCERCGKKYLVRYGCHCGSSTDHDSVFTFMVSQSQVDTGLNFDSYSTLEPFQIRPYMMFGDIHE